MPKKHYGKIIAATVIIGAGVYVMRQGGLSELISAMILVAVFVSSVAFGRDFSR